MKNIKIHGVALFKPIYNETSFMASKSCKSGGMDLLYILLVKLER